MMTVTEVSALTGLSVRALYDKIGLYRPTAVSEAGYRLYDDAALERLQIILLFRELQFPLKDIRRIMESTDFDRNRALEQQIALLELRREHLDNLITLARGLRVMGVRNLDFSGFDVKKIDEYERQAKASWGQTPEYREYEEKHGKRSKEEAKRLGVEFMSLFARLGELREGDPGGEAAQAVVKGIHEFINANFYTCSPEIFAALAKPYGGGGAMTENIDAAGGPGTGAFAARAVEIYCAKLKA